MNEQKKWKWSAHWHVAQGRGHKVISFVSPEKEGEDLKAVVSIRFAGVDNIHVIPCKGTVYNNVDVRRRMASAISMK